MNQNQDVKNECGPDGRGHMNPYLAGFLLGMVLFLSFITLGAGLGASGGLARIAAWLEGLAFKSHVLSSEYFGGWGENPLSYYLVFMLLGTVAGGFVSAWRAGRLKVRVEKGGGFPKNKRLIYALCGGLLVGFASRLAQGCTSGQALSGGALLLTGSLLFLCALFASGYGLARFFRRQWDD